MSIKNEQLKTGHEQGTPRERPGAKRERRLLIDNGGRIECETHVPYNGSDTFSMGAWRPMRVAERVEFRAEIGRAPRCETCMAIERRASEVTA
jgi:hypothetical protein